MDTLFQPIAEAAVPSERIADAYDVFAAAFQNRDIRTISDMLSDGYTWCLLTGETLGRTAALREIETFFRQTPGEIRFSAQVEVVSEAAGEVTVRAVEEIQADGSVSVEEVEERWRIDADRWRLVRTRVLAAR